MPLREMITGRAQTRTLIVTRLPLGLCNRPSTKSFSPTISTADGKLSLKNRAALSYVSTPSKDAYGMKRVKVNDPSYNSASAIILIGIFRAAHLVRQTDQHERMSGPNVQMVLVDGVTARSCFAGRHMKFDVCVRNERLREVDPGPRLSALSSTNVFRIDKPFNPHHLCSDL